MNKDIVVLIPAYDPNEEIMDTFLGKLTKKFENIVFINDGCSKKHDEYMKRLAKKYPVVKHNVNLGKGRGLKNGINYILNNYPDAKVIVTADCDGQHSVKDIKKCADVGKKNLDSLVLGVRNFSDKKVPARSKFGNVITRNVLYSFVGQNVSDTQTGLRAMSLDIAKELIAVSGERYEYETNVLIETKIKNIPIKEVVIETIYINDNETSHFNPVKDSIRVYRLFASYILFTLLAYIIETVIFSKIYDINSAFYVIPLFLLLSKIVSCIIKMIFNNHVNLKYVIINYVISAIILSLVKSHIILIKVIIDIIMFILSLFLIKFSTKKEN